MSDKTEFVPMEQRFRGYLPIVVDVETGGFNVQTDALLEIGAVAVGMDKQGFFHPVETYHYHVKPFENANLDPASLKVIGIDPYHPLRIAVSEKEALDEFFKKVRERVKQNHCTRAILVGHNASFDLSFINAAAARAAIKRNPFHLFSSMDTVTLGAMAYGQTVLSRAVEAANLSWNDDEAHSAMYDAQKTAELFCAVLNKWESTVQR